MRIEFYVLAAPLAKCHDFVVRPNVSLVVITKNEARNIERCLKSVDWAEDVVVLDSGSTDDTVALAKACGARVFVEEWRGYRAQKQRATELAQHDWVLSLDADEALSLEASVELRRALDDAESFDAFSSPRLSFHLGRWIRHGGWYPDRQTRLYHRSRAQWREGHLHERIEAPRVKKLQADIQHWPFTGVGDQVDTNNEYSKLGAHELRRRGDKFSLARLVVKPWVKFMECYFLKKGFMDGLPGFVIAVGAAYSLFLKYAKLWELEKS